MKSKNFYKESLVDLLFEQEEPEEDAAAEEAEAEEEAEDEEAPEEEGTEEETEEEAPEPEPEADSIDSDIEAILIDYESEARKNAVQESFKKGMLYESEDVIDLDSFTADVARLIKNYDNLIDMEGMLVNKSKEFLADRYGEETAASFVEKLETQHDIEEPKDGSPIPKSNLETPLAVGAGGTGE